MLDKIIPAPLAQSGPPVAAYRFLVVFFGGAEGFPNPIDIRFQEVSGMSADFTWRRLGTSTKTEELKKEGELTKFQGPPEFPNLTLKRGVVPGGSILRKEIELMILNFENFQSSPKNILVVLLSEQGLPVVAWMFTDARLMEYSLGNFDATSDGLLIETMEFSFTKWYPISL